MYVMPMKNLVQIMSTACFFGMIASPTFAQVTTSSTPGSTAPGSFAAPASPVLTEQSDAGRGALVSIAQAPRTDFDAVGARLGSFILLPSLELKETYTSNVYITPANVKQDFFTTIDPSVSLNSDWDRNAFGVTAAGDILRYSKYSSEDIENMTTRANGRLDIVQGMYFTGSGGYQILHEPRSSPNNVNGITPTEYDLASAAIGYVKENGLVGLKIDGTLNNYNYINVQTSSGVPVAETQRNRTEYEISGRVSYELVPQYKAFIKASGNDRVYDQKFDSGGYQRSSTGYQFDAGAALSIASKVDAEIYIGYLSQSFDDARLKDASGLGFGANLLWNVDGLTSIRGSLSRSIQETIVTAASSFISTDLSVGIEHELLRNVILTAAATYSNQDYQGGGRLDNVYGVDVSGKYLFNRYLSAVVDAQYNERSSNSVGVLQGSPYNQTQVSAKLRIQL